MMYLLRFLFVSECISEELQKLKLFPHESLLVDVGIAEALRIFVVVETGFLEQIWDDAFARREISLFCHWIGMVFPCGLE